MHFHADDDAVKMEEDLRGCLFLGVPIEVRLEHHGIESNTQKGLIIQRSKYKLTHTKISVLDALLFL